MLKINWLKLFFIKSATSLFWCIDLTVGKRIPPSEGSETLGIFAKYIKTKF